MKDTIKKYLEKKSIYKTKTFDCSEIAICIPICNEYPFFLSVLKNLAISCAVANQQVCIVCCVNNKINSSEKILQNNQRMIYELNRIANAENNSLEKTLLKVCVLDYTKENTFTEKQGVGWARKIAMDYALANGAKVLACLDADTLVEKNYVEVLYQFLEDAENKGELFGVTDFTHQKAENQFYQKAIDSYEGFLKFHSKKLEECGTPFYPVALGPTLVASNYAYCAVNGMNLKVAGEDFYFLQSLIKLQIADGKCLKTKILDTRVFPSSRISDRVLFGTGSRINELVEDAKNMSQSCENDKILEKISYPYYDEWIYDELKKFFAEKNPEVTKLKDFLEDEKFLENFAKMKKNYGKSQNRFEAAFHTWFDGLKIIRGIHFLERVGKETI